jgi:RNA polymerase sigma-70 factor, ECF subfamily
MVDWEQIARLHGPLVWRTVYRLLGYRAREAAADCFQETFLTAFDYSRRQEVRNWPGLLQRVATTRALDALSRGRSDARRNVRIGSADWEQVPSAATRPDAAAQEAELMEQFRLALAELPAGQREVFCLRFLSGMSYEDIAAENGTTVDAIGVSLHRARARLKQALLPLAGAPGASRAQPPLAPAEAQAQHQEQQQA